MDSEVFLVIVFGAIIVAIGIGVWLFVRHFANESAPEVGLPEPVTQADPADDGDA